MIESAPLGGDENPFFVLELPTTATPIEVERQKQKLLGMLELDLQQARQYASPLGPRERSSELVRRAAETLQDPARRLVWELWAAPEVAEAAAAHSGLRRRALGGEAIAASDVDAVGAAWDKVQDAEVYLEAVASSPASRGMDEPVAVAEAFDQEIEDQLTEVISRVPPFDLDAIESAIGQRAVARFLDREVEGLELTCQRLVAGAAAHTWDRWEALKEQHKALVDRRGRYAARAAFDAVYHDLSQYSVDRYNAEEFSLATEIFRWLRDRARAVGDDEAVVLQTKNTRIGEAALKNQRAPAGKSGLGGWGGFVIAMVLLNAFRVCLSNDSSPPDHQPEIRLDSESLERIRESTKHVPEPEPATPLPLDPQ